MIAIFFISKSYTGYPIEELKIYTSISKNGEEWQKRSLASWSAALDTSRTSMELLLAHHQTSIDIQGNANTFP